jgi:hypothetical protein
MTAPWAGEGKTRSASVFHPIDERGSFIKPYSDQDMRDPIVVRAFSNREGRCRFVVQKFLARFLEDTEGLDPDIAAWIETTLRRYAAAGIPYLA